MIADEAKRQLAILLNEIERRRKAAGDLSGEGRFDPEMVDCKKMHEVIDYAQKELARIADQILEGEE